MNYDEMRKMATEGIEFFNDDAYSGVHYLIRGGGVIMAGGEEVQLEEERIAIKGVIRDIKARDVDGETIRAGDKRGIFTYEVEILKGHWIVDMSEIRYEVVDPRPIRPSGRTIAYRPILRRVAIYG